MFAKRSDQCASPDVVSAAFIAKQGTKTSRTENVSVRGPADCGGARSGDKHNSRVLGHCREGQFKIGTDSYGCSWKRHRQRRADLDSGLQTARAGEPCADASDGLGLDAR